LPPLQQLAGGGVIFLQVTIPELSTLHSVHAGHRSLSQRLPIFKQLAGGGVIGVQVGLPELSTVHSVQAAHRTVSHGLPAGLRVVCSFWHIF